jgi:hypothetical protein
MAQLPPGRQPLKDEWFAKTAEILEQEMSAMIKHRDFPNNTCPASRHVQMIAESLVETGEYPMLVEDPRHCADSMASVISSLYSARSFLNELGYTWTVDDNGNVRWIPKNNY